jgi:hypothetical protein
MSAIERYALKPMVVGSTGYVLSSAVFSKLIDSRWGSDKFSFASNSALTFLSGGRGEVSVPMLVGVAVGAGSVLAEVSHQFIFPHIHWLDKSSEKASLVLAGGLSGAGMASILSMSNPAAVNELGLATIIGAGFATELIGDQIYTRFVQKPYESFVNDN